MESNVDCNIVTILCFHLITAADIGEVFLPSGMIPPITEGGDFMVMPTLSLPDGATLECDITVTVSTAPDTAVDSGMSHNTCNCPLGISCCSHLFCPQAQIQISWNWIWWSLYSCQEVLLHRT